MFHLDAGHQANSGRPIHAERPFALIVEARCVAVAAASAGQS
jgi:hypothetical protein